MTVKLPAAKKKGSHRGTRRNQATKAGWVDAQEGDRARTGLAATMEHYSDGTSSPEMSKGDGKSRATKGRSATASELYRAAKGSRRRHAVAFTALARSQERPQARLEDRRRTPAVGRWS